METTVAPASGAPILNPAESSNQARWPLPYKLVWRFAGIYIFLYGFPFITAFVPFAEPVGGWFGITASQPAVVWIGRHILKLPTDIVYQITGSGDTIYNYVLAAWYLALAGVGTVIWSLSDRRRANYENLHTWLRFFVRLALSAVLIGYGTGKVIPLQFPYPSLSQLTRTYGDSSPMGLLWTFMGASPQYTIITGAVELIAGLLLLIPVTVPIGALLSTVAMTQVFILNMCYDVPVKLFSFHLLAASVFLVGSDALRVIKLLVFNQTVEARQRPVLLTRQRANTLCLALPVALGLWMTGSSLWGQYHFYSRMGSGAPKTPLAGIWSVEKFVLNEEHRPSPVNDAERWRRVVFIGNGSVRFEPAEGEFLYCAAIVDSTSKRIKLYSWLQSDCEGAFTFEQPSPNQIAMEGVLKGTQIAATLTRVDKEFLLLNRGFHWIQERPFNR